MLSELAIRDFAIVEEVEVRLHAGLTAFTGETGAGKSILINALGMATGARARSDWIRPGAQQAEVSALFAVDPHGAAAAWLDQAGLASDEHECVVRRVVGADGRSRAWINTRPVPAQALRELGAMLVEIHGQHGQQALLTRGGQREILDAYGGHQDALRELAELHSRWGEFQRAAAAEPTELDADELALIDYQLSEIDALGLDCADIDALELTHRRLSHAGEIRDAMLAAREALRGETAGAAVAAIERARRELEAVARHDPALGEQLQLLESAAIDLAEVAQTLGHAVDAIEIDGAALAAAERKLGALHDLARKHRVAMGDVPQVAARLRQRIDANAGASEMRARRREQRDALLHEYRTRCQRLHRRRGKAATALGREVSAAIATLGMPGGKLHVRVTADGGEVPRPAGGDSVEFEVAANPGQPPRPLARVASGGELSRISLAVQTLDRRQAGAPTMVFDEVDAGIGGRVADAVAQELRRVAGTRQVLCVTHLAQVACRSAQHLLVTKKVDEAGARATIVALDADARVAEIARMIGGERITARTLAHASEMLVGATS